jgi:hypothetical protein
METGGTKTMRITMIGITVLVMLAGVGLESHARGAPAARKPAEEPGRVLLVSDEAGELDVLSKALTAKAGYAVEAVAQKALPGDLAAYDAVIMYIHRPILPAVESVLIAYARKGGRLLVLHHGIASAKWKNPKWLEFVGISMAPRDAAKFPWCVAGNVTHTMVNLAPGHYITMHKVQYDREVEYASPDVPSRRGRFPAFDLPNTEVFRHQRFTDGNAKTVLFGYQYKDAKTGAVRMEDTSGWMKPTGKGRLFYLQPGHAAHDFRNASLLQVILNCLDWQPE